MDLFAQDPAAMFDGGDIHGLDQTRLQFDQMAQEYAAEAGLMPGEAVEDPTQPLKSFAEQWRGQDGQWLGDEAERSNAYDQALQESYGLSSYALASEYANAAGSPPWSQGGPGVTWDPGALWPGVSGETGGPSWAGYWDWQLPNGFPALVTGLDPNWSNAGGLDFRQGDNVFGFEGDCGLVSVENVFHQFGISATEDGVISYAVNHIPPLCDVDPFDTGGSGGSEPTKMAQLLSENGVPATAFGGAGTQDLATWVDEGRGVILGVDSGILWDNPDHYNFGQPNHAITITGTARDPESGGVLGFYVCDSGRVGDPDQARRFVPAETIAAAWSGEGVVTEAARTQGWSPTGFGPQYA